jgi:hypothetical protein
MSAIWGLVIGQVVLLVCGVVGLVMIRRLVRRDLRLDAQAADLLDLAKGYAELARGSNQSAKRVLAAAEQKVDAMPATPSILEAVAAVPEATAAKVVEVLEHKAGDSGVHRNPKGS